MRQQVKVHKFPEKLYVYREEDGEDVYFLAEPSTQECMSADEDKKLVGVYELKEMMELKLHIEEIPLATTNKAPINKVKKEKKNEVDKETK
jgi:hypothetical protein